MSERLLNKVAVVTGGTSGIGLATAKRFVAEGARVFVFARKEAALSAAVDEIGENATGIQGDVTDLSDLARLYQTVEERAGRVDILFANAGIARHETIEAVSESSFDETFRTNVKGIFFSVQQALPLLPNEGTIIVNASMWTIKGIPGFGLLNASKAAVRSFVRTWASELKDRRIRVNAVSPGPVETPAIERATGDRDRAQQLFSELAEGVPLGRVAQPDEIAKAVVFLASNDASYVNGIELFVDGGMVQV